MSKCVAFLVLFTLTALGQEQSPRLAVLNVYGDALTAEGIWKADNLTEKFELVFDSVSHLECYKRGGQMLVGTEAYCMQATASIIAFPKRFGDLAIPGITVDYYPVVTWDEDKVIAADSSTAALPVCIWTQITVNLHDHSIMATDTRKLGKGHEGLDDSCKKMPLAVTYHLVDTTQELLRRQSRAQRSAKEKKEQ